MAKGTKKTKKERKKGRAEWEEEDSADEVIDLPASLVKGLKKAVAKSNALARVRWGMSQSVALGRLDEGRRYEIVNFTCEVEMPVPASLEKIADGIEIAQEIVEAHIDEKVTELEESLSDEDEDEDE